MRESLRKRDVQQWVIERWLTKYLIPSYKKIVIQNGGEISEALINARIWNYSAVTADCAIKHAQGSNNPVEAQLEAYTLKECRGKERHQRRFGVMRRSVALYEYFSPWKRKANIKVFRPDWNNYGQFLRKVIDPQLKTTLGRKPMWVEPICMPCPPGIPFLARHGFPTGLWKFL